MTNTKTQSEFCFIDNTKLKELAKECKTYVQKVLDEGKELDEIQNFDTDKTVNEQPVVNETTNEDVKYTSVEEPQDTVIEKKSVFNKDEEKSEEVVAPATLETEDSETNKKQNEDTVIEKKSVFNKLKGGGEKNKKKPFKLFAGLMKDAEGGDEDNQHKEGSSTEATVSYQPAVANNLFGNTGVTNQITFSTASDFRTVEERIIELYTRLMMETDRNKIFYIVNQIINLVPDKERFMKTLLSKLKGM